MHDVFHATEYDILGESHALLLVSFPVGRFQEAGLAYGSVMA